MWVTVWTLSVAFWYKSPKQSIKTKKIRARSIYLINSLPLSFATLLYQYEILVLDIYWQNDLCLDSFQHTHTPTKIQTLISIFNFLSLQGVLEVYGSVSWGQDYFGHGCNWVFSKECNNSYPIPLFLSFPLITAWMIIYIFSCNIDQCNFYGEDVKGATKCEEDLPSFKSSWCQVCFATLAKWGIYNTCEGKTSK